MPEEGLPPNYRTADCCRACKFSKYKETIDGDKYYCTKYEDRFGYLQEVEAEAICDKFKGSGK